MKNSYKILVFLILLSVGCANAQDFSYQYFSQSNPMVNNPAYAAFDYKMRADAGIYNLWAGGFKPVNDYMVSFSFRPDARKGKPRNVYSRVGLGAVFLREQIGPFVQNIFRMIYSYHIPLNRTTFLSLGISGSAESIGIDVNSLTPLNTDDPRILTGYNSAYLIDGGFGSALHGKNYTVSFSALNLASGDFRFLDNQAESIINYRKYFFAANYKMELNRNTFVQAYATIRNSRTNFFNYDASFSFDFSYFSFGAGYRSENSLFLFTKIPYRDFIFTYYSENPLAANHMIGNGHTFSIGWVLNPN
jgi:type IX secretion system PorP/SprF family membrane protein